MTDKEIVFELIKLGFDKHPEYANPTMIQSLSSLGAARIAPWLESLGKVGLVNEVRPIFASNGGNFEYKLSDEAVEIYNDQQKLNKKLSKILPELNNEYDVFLSYSNRDTESANELYKKLQDKGIKCYLAEVENRLGTKWMQNIHSAIKSSKLVLILLTPRSIKSPWVLIETGAAWALEKPLIPALKFVEPSEMMEPLQEYQARIIETHLHVDQLVTEIKTLIVA